MSYELPWFLLCQSHPCRRTVWYYSTYCWRNKRVYAIPEGISPKWNLIAWLEFRLRCYSHEGWPLRIYIYIYIYVHARTHTHTHTVYTFGNACYLMNTWRPKLLYSFTTKRCRKTTQYSKTFYILGRWYLIIKKQFLSAHWPSG